MACVAQLDRWDVRHYYADGSACTGVYGAPEQWPHVRAIYSRAGFVHDGSTEIVMIAQVDGLRGASDPLLVGLRSKRTVG